MTATHPVSIIALSRNDRGRIDAFVARIDAEMLQAGITEFELIFVDHRSTDGTNAYLRTLEERDPRITVRTSRKGRTTDSILQGASYARFETLALLDVGTTYEPGLLANILTSRADADIVIGHAKPRGTAFGKTLFGIGVDAQHRLKVCRKSVFESLSLRPTERGFDYDFLAEAERMRLVIKGVESPAPHTERRTSLLGHAHDALALHIRHALRAVFVFAAYPHHSEARPINFRNDKDFLFLQDVHSAKQPIYLESTVFLAALAVACVALLSLAGMLLGSTMPVVLSGTLTLFYFAYMAFKAWVIYHAVRNNPTIVVTDEEIAALKDEDLPIYTIIIPLYREERVIGQIIESMSAIDYPTDKLDITITLEEYDHPTIEAIKGANPPAHFKTLILPNVHPKTKPKALNVAFLSVKGEFLVIYDAEIIPDRDQLKKSVIAFRKNKDIACLQTNLDHYNPEQSLVTGLFNSEFSFHYDYYLPGLQKLGFPLPLSGHSTHFRTSVLETVGAWDPYNVTEDCDIGMRLYRHGFRTGLINSSSKEEATATASSWVLQRTRWQKGFIQTTFVHLRHPFRFKNEIGGWKNFLGFFFIVPGSIIVNILNLVSWVILAIWLAYHPPIIQALFPLPILYLAVFSFVAGNLFFTFMNLLATYQRGRYSVVKHNLLSFVYWILLAIATVRAAVEFVIKPHHWANTVHGTHLAAGRRYKVLVPEFVRARINKR